MSSKASALRFQVEAALTSRVSSPFQHREQRVVVAVPAGIPSVDMLTGGLPRGCLTEIYGPPCSGRTSLLVSALATRTEASEVCALVDARDAFDPHSAEAAGVKLEQLLWVRCRNIDQALRATDLLIQGGGFGLIALDLGDAPPHIVRYVPLQVWFRFRRAVEFTPTILVLLEQESNAKTCASLVLELRAQKTRWLQTSGSIEDLDSPHSPACLLGGWRSHAEIVRSPMKRENSMLIQRNQHFSGACGDDADFETEFAGNYSLLGKRSVGGGPRQR
jgi:recombination protein RecA